MTNISLPQITADGLEYIELGCSDKPPTAELVTSKVNRKLFMRSAYLVLISQGTGEDGVYFCGSDWCNGSPVSKLSLIIFALFLLIYMSM